MFNNPVAKDLCVDIYPKQAREGKSHRPGKQGFKSFWASLSRLAAGHSILELKCKTEETSCWECNSWWRQWGSLVWCQTPLLPSLCCRCMRVVSHCRCTLQASLLSSQIQRDSIAHGFITLHIMHILLGGHLTLHIQCPPFLPLKVVLKTCKLSVSYSIFCISLFQPVVEYKVNQLYILERKILCFLHLSDSYSYFED